MNSVNFKDSSSRNRYSIHLFSLVYAYDTYHIYYHVPLSMDLSFAQYCNFILIDQRSSGNLHYYGAYWKSWMLSQKHPYYCLVLGNRTCLCTASNQSGHLTSNSSQIPRVKCNHPCLVLLLQYLSLTILSRFYAYDRS